MTDWATRHRAEETTAAGKTIISHKIKTHDGDEIEFYKEGEDGAWYMRLYEGLSEQVIVEELTPSLLGQLLGALNEIEDERREEKGRP